MNAKQKAAELVKKFSPLVTTWDCYFDCTRNPDDILADAKKCALIAVGFAKENLLNTDGYNKYLDDVEAEIEKL